MSLCCVGRLGCSRSGVWTSGRLSGAGYLDGGAGRRFESRGALLPCKLGEDADLSHSRKGSRPANTRENWHPGAVKGGLNLGPLLPPQQCGWLSVELHRKDSDACRRRRQDRLYSNHVAKASRYCIHINKCRPIVIVSREQNRWYSSYVGDQ